MCSWVLPKKDIWAMIMKGDILVCVNYDLNGSLRINSRLHERLNNQLSHPIPFVGCLLRDKRTTKHHQTEAAYEETSTDIQKRALQRSEGPWLEVLCSSALSGPWVSTLYIVEVIKYRSMHLDEFMYLWGVFTWLLYWFTSYIYCNVTSSHMH